ncbi:MAG: hypothetical protein LBN29_04435 [Mediterranea sp.]|jgi:hypothetical protein|nr:hypothetical protein [Mediterranea sp.]
MKIKQYLKTLLFVWIGASFASACTDKESEYTDVSNADGIVVKCELNVADANVVTNTRAYDPTKPPIKSLSALVFDKDYKYLYRGSVKSIEGNTVSVKLQQSQNVADQQRVVLVANDDAIDKTVFVAGIGIDELDQQLPLKTDTLLKVKSDTDIPLFGQTDLISIGKQSPITTTSVRMLRALARIDIGLNFKSTAPNADDAQGLTDGKGNAYTLKEVALYHTRTSALAMPAPKNLSGDSKKLGVTAPTLPAECGTYTNKDDEKPGIDYSLSGNASVGDIFLAENTATGENPDGPTMMVVGIAYKGETTYYRVNIAKNQTAERLPVLRNNRYVFNIKEIRGRGFATRKEAMELSADNIEWQLDINDLDNTGTYVSGKKYFRTNYHVLVPGTEGAKVDMDFITNIASFSKDNMTLGLMTGGKWTAEDNPKIDMSIPGNPTPDANGVIKGKIRFTPNTYNLNDSIAYSLRVELPPLDAFYVNVTLDKGRLSYDIVDAKANGIYLPVMKLGNVTKKYELIPGVHTMTVTIRTKSDYEHTDAKGKMPQWNLHTEEVNGYQFSGKGTFTKGKTVGAYKEYTVTLAGSGTPKKGGFDNFKLMSDAMTIDDPTTLSVYKNKVRVTVGYTPKTMLTYSSYQGTYGYATESGASNAFMTNEENIGLEGTLPVQSIKRLRASRGALTDDFTTKLATNPDIVLLGYECYLGGNYKKYATALADYVNKGGIVIYFCDGYSTGNSTAGVDNFCKKIDGCGSLKPSSKNIPASGQGTSKGGTFLYTPSKTLEGDPFLDGPFGCLHGKSWGQDRKNSVGVGQLPNTAVAYTYNGDRSDLTYATSWRYKGLFWVGDGGFIAQDQRTGGDSDSCTYWTDATGIPLPCSNTTPLSSNSIAFGNMLYWAIDRAEFQGTTQYEIWGKKNY